MDIPIRKTPEEKLKELFVNIILADITAKGMPLVDDIDKKCKKAYKIANRIMDNYKRFFNHDI